jgi:hypothetical protein
MAAAECLLRASLTPGSRDNRRLLWSFTTARNTVLVLFKGDSNINCSFFLLVEEINNKIEHNLELLGLTAIEVSLFLLDFDK